MFPLISHLSALPMVAALVALLAIVAASLPVFAMAGFRVRPLDDFMRVLIAQGLLDGAGGYLVNAGIAKTANYNVVAPVVSTGAGDPSGTVFTNRGAAGAVTFTLPAVVPAMAGLIYDFIGHANQTFAVAGPAAAVITFNNAAATSVTCSTAGAKIGAHIRAFCDGLNWFVIGDTVGVTYTVA